MWALGEADPLHAQGVATGAIRGTVRMADQSDPDGARVVARNAATGFVVEASAIQMHQFRELLARPGGGLASEGYER